MPRQSFPHPIYPHVQVPVAEEWKDIQGYEGSYQASTKGRIRSLDRIVTQLSGSSRVKVSYPVKGKILSLLNTPKGYKHVCLSFQKRLLVHALILKTFTKMQSNGLVCRHLNGDPADNRLENLCWGTLEENWEDRKKHGRTNSVCGEDHCCSILTELQVIKIRHDHKNGVKTAKELAAQYGLHVTTIRQIAKRLRWKHVK